jgi:shikimate dehydrogenase
VKPAITGRTQVAALIGQPVGHSFSPAIHNAAFAALGLDWVYVAFAVAPDGLVAALGAVRSLGIGGLSITMPHKDRVAALVDAPSVAVRALGACNTVVAMPGARLAGENTDGDGLVDALFHGDVAVEGARVVVLGAGGAGRSVAEALGRWGAADVAIVNRTHDRALVAAQLAGAAGRVGSSADVADADIVVNATSVGMGTSGLMPIGASLLRPGLVVFDAVYNPIVTPLLAAARSLGCQTFDGLAMLVCQAARQFKLWTGQDAPIEVMRVAVQTAIGSS